LVRLNPNIPWKTRGNGALALHFEINAESVDSACRIALETVENTSDLSASATDPVVVFLKGRIPGILREYSSRALYDVLSVREAKEVAKIANADTHFIKGSRGVIGSLAALGAGLDSSDHSFEIIAYRSRENLGKPRQVDLESVRRMDTEFKDVTFQNLDHETGRILVCPHGPDPVLLGIRGKDPSIVREAFRRILIHERVEAIMIFKTNQGTDAHISFERRIAHLRRYQSALVSGEVIMSPRVLRGGHVVFPVGDGTGFIDCVAFRPTESVARIARQLRPGDKIRVSGGVQRRPRRGFALNLEKIEIVELTQAFNLENPLCPKCGARCESMGRRQGLRCKKCDFRSWNLTLKRVPQKRDLTRSIFIPPPRARRHLTKPDASSSVEGQRSAT
jgi:tRNA(Ile2)-agmatinylcytidine synthase